MASRNTRNKSTVPQLTTTSYKILMTVAEKLKPPNNALKDICHTCVQYRPIKKINNTSLKQQKIKCPKMKNLFIQNSILSKQDSNKSQQYSINVSKNYTTNRIKININSQQQQQKQYLTNNFDKYKNSQSNKNLKLISKQIHIIISESTLNSTYSSKDYANKQIQDIVKNWSQYFVDCLNNNHKQRVLPYEDVCDFAEIKKSIEKNITKFKKKTYQLQRQFNLSNIDETKSLQLSHSSFETIMNGFEERQKKQQFPNNMNGLNQHTQQDS